MKMLLLSLLLLTATNAQATIQSVTAVDPSMIRPVSMAEKQHETDLALKRACKPVFLFMRFPDGHIMLMGAFKPNGC